MELKHLDLIEYSYKIIISEKTEKHTRQIDSVCHKINAEPNHFNCFQCQFCLKSEISTVIPEHPQEFILCKKKHDKKFFPSGFLYIVSYYAPYNLYTFDPTQMYDPELIIC